MQALVGIIVITPAIAPGMAMSYSAVALRQLDLDLNEGSWFGEYLELSTFLFGLFFCRVCL